MPSTNITKENPLGMYHRSVSRSVGRSVQTPDRTGRAASAFAAAVGVGSVNRNGTPTRPLSASRVVTRDKVNAPFCTCDPQSTGLPTNPSAASLCGIKTVSGGRRCVTPNTLMMAKHPQMQPTAASSQRRTYDVLDHFQSHRNDVLAAGTHLNRSIVRGNESVRRGVSSNNIIGDTTPAGGNRGGGSNVSLSLTRPPPTYSNRIVPWGPSVVINTSSRYQQNKVVDVCDTFRTKGSICGASTGLQRKDLRPKAKIALSPDYYHGKQKECEKLVKEEMPHFTKNFDFTPKNPPSPFDDDRKDSWYNITQRGIRSTGTEARMQALDIERQDHPHRVRRYAPHKEHGEEADVNALFTENGRAAIGHGRAGKWYNCNTLRVVIPDTDANAPKGASSVERCRLTPYKNTIGTVIGDDCALAKEGATEVINTRMFDNINRIRSSQRYGAFNNNTQYGKPTLTGVIVAEPFIRPKREYAVETPWHREKMPVKIHS